MEHVCSGHRRTVVHRQSIVSFFTLEGYIHDEPRWLKSSLTVSFHFFVPNRMLVAIAHAFDSNQP